LEIFKWPCCNKVGLALLQMFTIIYNTRCCLAKRDEWHIWVTLWLLRDLPLAKTAG